jgi:hypothetical protein
MAEHPPKRRVDAEGSGYPSIVERAQRNRRGILWAMALTMAAVVLLILHFSR